MSLNCQIEQLTSSYTLDGLSREVVIEAQLKIPETNPKIDTIIGGNIQMGAPEISVDDKSQANTHSLVISGVIHPQLFYVSAEFNDPSNRHRIQEYSDQNNDQSQIATDSYAQWEPKEHSYTWSGEGGLIYAERIETTGLQSGNAVEVKVIPKSYNFEKNGLDRVNFSAHLVISIQPTAQKQDTIISDLTVQPLEKVNVIKEQITTEQLNAVKTATVPIWASLLLPGLKPGISRVINCEARPYNVNWEYNRGKIYVKGLLDISLVYVGLDDNDLPTAIMANEWNRDSGNPVPFETHFDTEVPEENLLVVPSVITLNTGITVKSRREVQCQVNLDCQVAISRIHSCEIVTEVTPGPGIIIDKQKALLNLEEFLGETAGEVYFELAADLPAGQPGVERLLTYHGQFVEPKAEIAEGTATIDGHLNLWVLYTADGPEGPELHAARWESGSNNQLPITGVIEFPSLQSGSLLRVQTTLDSIKVELISERSLKISGQIKTRLVARSPRTLSILADCAEVIPVNPETRPSMLFYIVQPGDTLWKIARRYQTTVAQILQSNQINNEDRIEAGRKLLIPKQVAG